MSAIECTDSASIDELPVIAKPMNLATAIPALAASAAMIALLLPPADIDSPSVPAPAAVTRPRRLLP
ncbi:Uncharacterised protein [Mycobacteroides abscessus subsp. abscessus]|nr:Uncharacterised protein [Mycobacteroides abscessus subsp. abscessus]